jgi:uncharacterized protein with von Willebrand factor type A (vWA) domain
MRGEDAVNGNVLLANVGRFGRLLRRAGLDVDSGQSADFLQAMALVGVDRRADVRAAGRAIFVRRREDQATYERAFDLFWRRHGGPSALEGQLPRLREDTRRESPADPAAPGTQSGEDEVAAVRLG